MKQAWSIAARLFYPLCLSFPSRSLLISYLLTSSFRFSLTLFRLRSIFLPLSLFCSHILTVLNFITRTFSFTHPRSFLLSSRVFMRVLCATPFLQFSQFNATCRYGFATIPIIRCTHTTSSSIMAMTAVPPFLFMPPYFSPARSCSLCLFVVRCRSLGLFPLTLPFSSLFPIAFSCPRDVQVRQSGEVSVRRMFGSYAL